MFLEFLLVDLKKIMVPENIVFIFHVIVIGRKMRFCDVTLIISRLPFRRVET